MKKKREAPMSPSLMIAIGFALLILLVTLLLMLPISSQSRTVTPPLTALFTATSAVCVTGQVLVDTGMHWSLFGQVVLIAAIQIGGLGVMTLLALVSMAMGRRIGLRQRTILQESVASFSVGGIVRLIRLALIGTAVIEGLGAAALAFRFVPMLGWAKGLWYSVFHAISAFCNAGFDLMGPVSGSFSSREWVGGAPRINQTVMTRIMVAGRGVCLAGVLRGRPADQPDGDDADSGRGAGLSGLAGSGSKPPVLEKTAPAHAGRARADGVSGARARRAVLHHGEERDHGGHDDGHARLGEPVFRRHAANRGL